MFDVSFTELLVIGVVALVVIGPEKLPRVARTVGHLMGRAQRYVNDVKREIRQELDAADQASGGLTALKQDVQDAARSLEHSLSDATQTLRQPLQAVQESMQETAQQLTQEAAQPGQPLAKPEPDAVCETPSEAPAPPAGPDRPPKAKP